MVVVVVLVVLVVAGVVAALVFLGRSRRRATDDVTISSADRIEASMPAIPAQRALPAGPTVDTPALEAGVDEEAGRAVDGDAAARFRPPGERSSRAITDHEPMTPAVVVHHLEGSPQTDDAATEPETEPAPESEAPIESVIVLTDDAVAGPGAKAERESNVDDVVTALIERVRNSPSNDMMAVVSEMVDHDLGTDQMEEVLTHLVERERARPNRDELTLSGPDVPQRPGRLSAFADMGEDEKRRVIIRVLCLLIARSEDEASNDDQRPLYTVELPPADDLAADGGATPPTARDLWGDPDDSASEVHLPARRRRLARSRR